MGHRGESARAAILALIGLTLGTAIRLDSPAQAQSWVPLPAGLHLLNATGSPLPLPTLQLDGPPLMVSDSPEQITADTPVTVLCRTRPGASRFRVFFHHQNATTHSLQIGFAVTNRSAAPVQLYMARNSQSLPIGVSTGAAGSTSPAEAGRRALVNWFSSRHGPDQAPGQDKYLVTLPPGGIWLVTQAVAGQIGGGETLTGMYDLAVSFANTAKTDTPTVEVATLAYRGAVPTPQALAGVATAPPDPSAAERCRGLFPHATRRGTLTYAVTDTTPRWLDLGGPDSGAFDHSPPGEYESAIPDPTDPAALRRDGGNYGVVYDLDVTLTNLQPFPVRVHSLMNVAGGDGCSVIMVDETTASGPPVLHAFDSWAFQDVMLGSGASRHIRLRFSLPGGSSGAHRLFFWPQSENAGLRPS